MHLKLWNHRLPAVTLSMCLLLTNELYSETTTSPQTSDIQSEIAFLQNQSMVSVSTKPTPLGNCNMVRSKSVLQVSNGQVAYYPGGDLSLSGFVAETRLDF